MEVVELVDDVVLVEVVVVEGAAVLVEAVELVTVVVGDLRSFQVLFLHRKRSPCHSHVGSSHEGILNALLPAARRLL